MEDLSKETLEQTKLELNAYFEEYKALRAEIVSTLTSSYQVMNITIAATAVQVSSLPTILQWQKPYLLALTPFVFYSLVWIQLRYVYAVYNMSNHIIEVISPSIRSTLSKMSMNNQDFSGVFTWESAGRSFTHPKAAWLYPIELARYAVPLITAFIVFLSYIIIIVKQKSVDFVTDSLLIFINITLLIYTLTALLLVRSFVSGSKTTKNN